VMEGAMARDLGLQGVVEGDGLMGIVRVYGGGGCEIDGGENYDRIRFRLVFS